MKPLYVIALIPMVLSCATYHTLQPVSRSDYYHPMSVSTKNGPRGEASYTVHVYGARNNIYSGTRWDMYKFANDTSRIVPDGCLRAFYAAEMPLSFAADTLALPYTIPNSILSGLEEKRFNRDALPLFKASLNNDPHAVRALLARGVDPNVQDGEMRTALHFAVQAGALEAGRELIHGNAKLNVYDEAGFTPLDRATLYYLNCPSCPHANLRELIVLLAEKGAYSPSARRLAERHGDADILSVLKRAEPAAGK